MRNLHSELLDGFLLASNHVLLLFQLHLVEAVNSAALRLQIDNLLLAVGGNRPAWNWILLRGSLSERRLIRGVCRDLQVVEAVAIRHGSQVSWGRLELLV